jgi:hypothetical protein
VALCQARTSTKPLWGLSSSNPYHPSHVPNKMLSFSKFIAKKQNLSPTCKTKGTFLCKYFDDIIFRKVIVLQKM